MVYPVAVLKQLNLPRKVHNLAIFVIGIGFVSVIAGVIRFIGIWPASGSRNGSSQTQDAVRSVIFWSHIEFIMAFVAACLPSYRVLYRSLRSLSKGAGGHSGSSSHKNEHDEARSIIDKNGNIWMKTMGNTANAWGEHPDGINMVTCICNK